jgi:hypothetical protein
MKKIYHEVIQELLTDDTIKEVNRTYTVPEC